MQPMILWSIVPIWKREIISSFFIILAGGRLKESSLLLSVKHPTLLLCNDILVKILLNSIHEENKHCGPQSLLATTRQKDFNR